MRVAHVASFRPSSANGVLVAAARLSAHLVQCGVEIEVWHFRRDRDTVLHRRDKSGVDIFELPFPLLVGGGVTHLRRMPDVTRRWIDGRHGALDGIHFHSVFQPESWYLAKRTSFPFCLSPHGGYRMFARRSWRSHAKQPLWRLFERDVLGGARFVHALSLGEAETIWRLEPSAHVSVVPNGVEIPEKRPNPPEKDAPWLFVGRFDVETKGLDVLIEGYALASRRLPLPTLVIRGPDFRGGRAQLDKLVRRHRLSDRVLIGGPALGREKEELIQGCGLFLHPSRNEGLPLAPLEALAFGRPIAVTPETNLADIVRKSGAGFVIPSSTTGGVADILEAAARTRPEDLILAGSRARHLAEREFSWDVVARQMLRLYRKHFNAH